MSTKTQKPDEMRKTAGGFHWAKCLHCGAWHVWSESLSLQELADRCALMVGPKKMKASDIRYRNEGDLVAYLKQELIDPLRDKEPPAA